jgi:hypothetical protein
MQVAVSRAAQINTGAYLIPYAAASARPKGQLGMLGARCIAVEGVVSARMGAQVISRVHLRAWYVS